MTDMVHTGGDVPLHGIVAEFADPEALRAAARAASAAGYTRIEAFAPFPMPDLARLLGTRPSVLPWIALAAGLAGAMVQYGAQYWMNAVDYPLNVGGRPLHAWPAFIPATLIVAILWAGTATLVGMLVILRLPRLHHPVFAVEGFERASEDRFFLLLRAGDPRFEPGTAEGFLAGQGALAVRRVPT